MLTFFCPKSPEISVNYFSLLKLNINTILTGYNFVQNFPNQSKNIKCTLNVC